MLSFDFFGISNVKMINMTHPTLLSVLGVDLEVKYIPLDKPLELRDKGPSLVFLHEGLGSVALWKDWPAQICQSLGCEGWVYSRQGYGQSDGISDVRGAGKLNAHYMHREALEVLPALLAHLGIAKPILIGHSDGGTIALIHASQLPVSGCVVMAPHVMVEDISIQAISLARDHFEKLKPKLAAFHKDVDIAFWQWNDVWLSEAFRSFDIRPLLPKIKAPLLAIQGLDDAYGTMKQIDEIAAKVPQAQLLKLGNCGHSPHKDQPEKVLQALKYFSSSLGKIQRH
jgi:pimeloyl-ACP methyl ester carboxylesterase